MAGLKLNFLEQRRITARILILTILGFLFFGYGVETPGQRLFRVSQIR